MRSSMQLRTKFAILITLAALIIATPLPAGARDWFRSQAGAGASKRGTQCYMSGYPAVSTYGENVHLHALVTPYYQPKTGTVSFYNVTGGVTILLGTVAVSNGNNETTADFDTTTLPVVSLNNVIKAEYNGDIDYYSSGMSLPQYFQVSPASTSTNLVSAPDPTVFGEAFVLTATVATVAPGSGVPDGTVTFNDGATTVGTAAVNGSGVATLQLSSLAVGSHSLTATYNGSANNGGSSGSSTKTVTKAASTTTLISSQNPSANAQTVTFTAAVAAVAPGVGTPTGSVNFLVDGAVSVDVPLVGNQATYDIGDLIPGGHTIEATYSGDGSFATSASPDLSQVVSATATRLTLTSSGNPSAFGQAITLTATAADGGLGTPRGTFTLTDGTAQVGSPVALDGSGKARFTIAMPSTGAHSYKAAYSGDGLYTAATSSLQQTVNTAATATVLTSSVNPSTLQQPVTFTATVSGGPATPVPSGSVTFFNGTTSLGKGTLNASGVATATYANLTTGLSTITARYTGDTNYATSTSSAVTQNVITSPFTMSVDHKSATVASGGSAAYRVVVTDPDGSFPDTVVFSVSGLPTTLVATLAPSSVPASSNPAATTVTVSPARSSATMGPWPLRLPTAPGLPLGLFVVTVASLAALLQVQRTSPSLRVAGVLFASMALVVVVLGVGGCGSGGGDVGSYTTESAVASSASPTATPAASPTTSPTASPTASPQPVAAGTYPFTLTATSGSQSVSQQMSVTIK